MAESKPPLITIDDLIKQEKDTGRKALLSTSLKPMKDIDKKLNYFAESAVAMNINSTRDLDSELSKLRTEQTSAVMAPGSSPNAPAPAKTT